MKRRIAAILAADVAGYSRLVAEAEEETLQRLAAYREVFDEFVGRHGGRIFNTAGDSVMCAFDSAVEATRCAIDIQESLRTRNLSLPANRRLQFRIGISIGDVVERDGDMLGDGVNIAARLESLAEPGGICVSRSVHETVANKISVPFRDIGAREVKNIPQPVHAFVVAWPQQVAEVADRRALGGLFAALPRPGAPMLMALAAAVVVAVAVVLWAAGALTGRAPSTTPPTAGTPPSGHATGAAEPGGQDDAAAFAALARRGGIVPDASSAAELYHNARLYEARGDTPEARRAYLALARLGGEQVDPLLRLAALLRAGEGRAGAREVLGELLARRATRAAALVHALQFEGTERRTKVEAFAAAHPDFAPAFYLLAGEYGEGRLGTRTLTDRRLEFEALERFLAADEEGRLPPFFLDQSVLAEWLDDARRRRGETEAFFATGTTRPVASFTRSNAGWHAALSMPEPATAISYRIGDTGEFRATGTSQVLDPRTGKPAPLTSFPLPADQEKTSVYVMYDDAAGRPVGPFVIDFDPHAALVAGQRDALRQAPGAWIAFRADGPTLVYYTHLVSYRCALQRAVMGIDGGPLETVLPLPPCDESNPYAVPANVRPYLIVPDDTRTVSVQLVFADGSRSQVETFRRPAARD
ncbi:MULTISPECIES: adenylate/guanylate cyclase domain-containing protein [unclassified Chelatococcus]|uniref:adenylate/guanylate cyclase domain-containing protein n=1 Tax=unclassified Chelatococcus TaxID=2638111 RepID=UPI0002EAF210|nr:MULTISPECIES: adenylate/guanylate cyclase domain-containing protein [unclassified Chelatococcus]